MKKIAASLLVALFLLLGLYPANTTENNPYGVSTIDPAGPNEIIFTISKGEKMRSFTVAQLLKLKSSTISIYEPFIKKRQVFTVIPIKSFFNLVGISGTDRVSTNALNDYVYKNLAKNFLDAQTFVAIKQGGREISYDQGGPLRLIFADGSKWVKQKDAWNWSLKSISVG